MRKLKNNELNRKSVSEFKSAEKTPYIIVLDDVRSLNNIGSIFRTSDALIMEAIYLCGITAQPPHKDIHKTALGATESVDWKYFGDIKDALSSLRQGGYHIYAIEQAENSTMLDEFEIDPNAKYAFIFGNEVKGVAQDAIDLSDGCIEIPQFGTKHSFNISVSAGIVLWDLFVKYASQK